MYEQEKWELRARTARQNGLPSVDDVAIAIIKPLKRPTRSVPKRRVRALRAHLTQLFSAIGDNRAALAASPQGQIYSKFENVCRACKGSCCRNGGDHGYLKRADLLSALSTLPEMQYIDVIDAYLIYIPRRSYIDSCIFHAAEGCTLPRNLRSQTCNTYFCAPLDKVRTIISRQGPILLVAVMNGDQSQKIITQDI